MSYEAPPKNLTALNARMMNLEGEAELVTRRRATMAIVIIGQMLPEGAVKGGSAMALRYGASTRFTRDLDAARSLDAEQFRSDFEERLSEGWEGFTARLVETRPPTPLGVPAEYVMQPFDVKLQYKGQSWCTVPFELGHNEIGDAENPEPVLAETAVALFTSLGFPAPAPVPVMPTDHQIAQKLHACTSAGNDRARDLVDLQLLDDRELLDLRLVRSTCTRLFDYRKAHAWPPSVISDESWESLYAAAADGLPVAADLETAINRVNDLIDRIDHAEASDE